MWREMQTMETQLMRFEGERRQTVRTRLEAVHVTIWDDTRYHKESRY